MKPSRALGIFLLLFAGGAAAAQAADPTGVLLQWVSLIVSGIIVPVLMAFRKETRDALHQLRNELTTARLDIARMESTTKERDRVTELLDRRLSRE